MFSTISTTTNYFLQHFGQLKLNAYLGAQFMSEQTFVDNFS